MYIHTPIITGNDAEGSGNTFGIYTDGKDPKTAFFGKEVALTVSGNDWGMNIHKSFILEEFMNSHSHCVSHSENSIERICSWP